MVIDLSITNPGYFGPLGWERGIWFAWCRCSKGWGCSCCNILPPSSFAQKLMVWPEVSWSLQSLQGMVQLYYDKYIAKPLRLPTVRLGTFLGWGVGKYYCGMDHGMDKTHTIILFQGPSTFRLRAVCGLQQLLSSTSIACGFLNVTGFRKSTFKCIRHYSIYCI